MTIEPVAALESQISKGRVTISAESISMSISELTNLYKEDVLRIRPEFQRLYRWTDQQKSRLIESVLLGIPLPSMFVSQQEGGKWELVDGLQRVSTLLELQGLLPNDKGGIRPALHLTTTKYLENLEGFSWDGNGDTTELSPAQKLDIRLARLDLRVIRRNSDARAKFDLFQRLNSFGTQLSAQDSRSAMIAGTNSAALSWLTALARHSSFRACVSLSERLLDEQYDLELVLRFLMLHQMDVIRTALADFPSKLDDWSLELAADLDARRDALDHTFKTTFDLLAASGGEDLFRKWDTSRRRFTGAFGNTPFEILALGLGHHVANGTQHREDYDAAAREIWEGGVLPRRFATGLATQDRMVLTVPLGRRHMAVDRSPAALAP